MKRVLDANVYKKEWSVHRFNIEIDFLLKISPPLATEPAIVLAPPLHLVVLAAAPVFGERIHVEIKCPW